MEIICLFVQRKCQYEGQYAPALEAAMDDISESENPEYLDLHEARASNDGDILFSKRITVMIDDDKFNSVFFGQTCVDGQIKEADDAEDD